MWKFYFPTMIHAKHKVLQTLQTSLTCGKPNRLNFHKWGKKNFVPMQEKKSNLSYVSPAGGIDDLFPKHVFKAPTEKL